MLWYSRPCDYLRRSIGSNPLGVVRQHFLGRHIRNEESDTRIFWINGWPRHDIQKSGGHREYIKRVQRWKEGAKTVFIYDEAQLSYWDIELWRDFFRDISRRTPDRWTIVFASYGSPTSRFKIKGTLVQLKDMQRVTQKAIDHHDNLPSVGLFFLSGGDGQSYFCSLPANPTLLWSIVLRCRLWYYWRTRERDLWFLGYHRCW